MNVLNWRDNLNLSFSDFCLYSNEFKYLISQARGRHLYSCKQINKSEIKTDDMYLEFDATKARLTFLRSEYSLFKEYFN